MVTSSETIPVPDRDELVKRAAAMRHDLWQDAPACDRARRLTGRVAAEILRAGLTRLLTPRRYGGYEADMRTVLDVNIELGRGCGSASWVTGVLNAGNFVTSLYPRETQDEVWGENPDATAALVLGAPARNVQPADGGVTLSGQWAYASGSLHCDLVNVLVLVPGANGVPKAHFALLRADEVTISDTWYFAGMRGTGSNTVVAENVFVPNRRLIPYQPVLDGETDGLVGADHIYRNSLTGLFMIGLIGSMIGAADTAFQLVLEQSAQRPVAGSTYKSQADSPMLQIALSEAAMKIDAAKLQAERIADTVDEFARAGRNSDLVTRARARMSATEVGRLCREAVDTLVTAYGTSAFSDANPLQMIWRDINVGSRHAGFGMGIPQQVYGHALLGRDPRLISAMV